MIIDKHAWAEIDEYNIRAKAKDYEKESDWAYYHIPISRNKGFSFSLFELLFERFPNAFPILRQLLDL